MRFVAWWSAWVVVAVALAGCTDASDDGSPGAPPSDDDGSDGGDDIVGALAGDPGGVVSSVLTFGDEGGVQGLVYDFGSGSPLEDAEVTGRCQDEEVIGVRATAISDDEGRFALPTVPELMACDAVRYDVRLAGYHLRAPLVSPPLDPNVLHVVHAAMQADDA